MVGHQTIPEHPRAIAMRTFAKKVQIKTPVVRTEEDGLTVVAALRYMMGNTREDGSGSTGHSLLEKWTSNALK